MRVAFVDNLLFEDAGGIRRYILQPHLGLISLIAVLERAGHTGLLYDPKVEVGRARWRWTRSSTAGSPRKFSSSSPTSWASRTRVWRF